MFDFFVPVGILRRNLNVRKPCKFIKQLVAIWCCVSLLLPSLSEKKNMLSDLSKAKRITLC